MNNKKLQWQKNRKIFHRRDLPCPKRGGTLRKQVGVTRDFRPERERKHPFQSAMQADTRHFHKGAFRHAANTGSGRFDKPNRLS